MKKIVVTLSVIDKNVDVIVSALLPITLLFWILKDPIPFHAALSVLDQGSWEESPAHTSEISICII